MPPEVSSWHPIVTPFVPSLPTASTKTVLKQTLYHKYCLMKMTAKRKLIPILVFILAIASILRLLKLAVVSSTSRPPAAFPPTLQYAHSDELKNQSSLSFPGDTILTYKEMKFLSDLISSTAPCNVLVFGFKVQYSFLAALNEGGNTVFLEDNCNVPHWQETDKVLDLRHDGNKTKNNNDTRVYKIEYRTVARDAYKLLKHARKGHHCSPAYHMLHKSKCKLALRKLPHEVYELHWDIVVIDGPCGHKPDCPGRMSAIYTASLLARKGNVTHVVVHDIDRLIEKWFSWEFLCEENLVSSKGKFWDFRIAGLQNSTKFCPI